VTAAGPVALLLYAVFSVTAVHDYLAWNRVRWQALHHLTGELSVPAERIDGGFEFNGLYTYDENYIRTPGKSFWWVKSDDYMVAFNTMPGYALLRKYPVRSWLPAAVHHIYVLKRTTP
jgi:predicted acetyltransferase